MAKISKYKPSDFLKKGKSLYNIHMDETRYEAGYRDALLHTIEHITHRIREEKSYGDLWLNRQEFDAYIRALNDIKSYLLWITHK